VGGRRAFAYGQGADGKLYAAGGWNGGYMATACNTQIVVDVPWLSENPMTGPVPAGATQEVSVTFDATGLTPFTTYSASLTVAHNTPYAVPDVPVSMYVVQDALAALPSADAQQGYAPFAVNFTGAASGGDNGPYTYRWDFGDGSAVSTVQNPSHTFDPAGVYTVTLTVQDTHGGMASATLEIQAHGKTFVSFVDDLGRARLCVDRITGGFTWEILSGPYMGTGVTGTLLVKNGGTLFMTPSGTTYYVYCSYDPIRKRATAYYYDYVTHIYSQIMDSNTADNPVGCGP
jgi:hypothetical protein